MAAPGFFFSGFDSSDALPLKRGPGQRCWGLEPIHCCPKDALPDLCPQPGLPQPDPPQCPPQQLSWLQCLSPAALPCSARHGTARHCCRTRLSWLQLPWFSQSRGWQLSAPSWNHSLQNTNISIVHKNRFIPYPFLQPTPRPPFKALRQCFSGEFKPSSRKRTFRKKFKKSEKAGAHEGVSSLQPAPRRGIPPCDRPRSATKHLPPI